MYKLKKILSLPFIFFLSSILIIFICSNGIDRNYILTVILIALILIVMTVIFFKTVSVIILPAVIIFALVVFFRICSIAEEYKNIPISSDVKIAGYIADYQYIKNNTVYFKFRVTHRSEGTFFISVKPYNVLVRCRNQNIQLKKWETLIIKGKIRVVSDREVNGFNYHRFLRAKNIRGIVDCAADGINLYNGNLSVRQYLKYIGNTRPYILERFEKILTKETYSFILSIFFGDRSLLDEQVTESYRDSGMVHLLAISGFHIGFIGMIFSFLFSIFMPKDTAKLLSSFVLLLYILLLNSSPSSMRAFLMYFIQSLYFYTGIKTGCMTPISIAGIIMILFNPFSIFDMGFILSFTATGGILLYADVFDSILPDFLPSFIKSNLSVSLAAFMVTFSIQASVFGRIPFFSIVSGLFIIPLFTILFIMLFIFSSLLIFIESGFIGFIMDFLISLFNKLVYLAGFVKPLEVSSLNKSMIFLIPSIMIIAVYIVPDVFFKCRRLLRRYNLHRRTFQNLTSEVQ